MHVHGRTQSSRGELHPRDTVAEVSEGVIGARIAAGRNVVEAALLAVLGRAAAVQGLRIQQVRCIPDHPVPQLMRAVEPGNAAEQVERTTRASGSEVEQGNDTWATWVMGSRTAKVDSDTSFFPGNGRSALDA